MTDSNVSGKRYFNKSGINRNFTAAIILIYPIFIIIISALVFLLTNSSREFMLNTLTSQQVDFFAGNIRQIHKNAVFAKNTSIDQASTSLIKKTDDLPLLSHCVFGKTADDNYFRVLYTKSTDPGFTCNLKKGNVVKNHDSVNYLRKGFLETLSGPVINESGIRHRVDIYAPLKIGSKRYVSQYTIDLTPAIMKIRPFDKMIKRWKIILLIIVLIITASVITCTRVFVMNYSILINELTATFKKAASGDLSVSMKETIDYDLRDLAVNFNSLMEEIRGTKEQALQPEHSEIFKQGVTLLKDNRLREAYSFFETMIHIRPDSFASHFNLGVIHARNRNYEDALIFLRRALELNPEHELSKRYIERIKKLNNGGQKEYTGNPENTA